MIDESAKSNYENININEVLQVSISLGSEQIQLLFPLALRHFDANCFAMLLCVLFNQLQEP